MSNETNYRTLSFLGYPKYRVGPDGSFWRLTKHKGWVQRKGNIQGVVTLSRTIQKKKETKSYRLGNLVLRAFVGLPPQRHECCHYPDPNPRNNRLENLRWDTHTANMKDMVIHGHAGRARNGIPPGNAKITMKVAKKIRALHKTKKYSLRELGDMVGLKATAVHSLVTGKTWRE